MNWSLFVCSRFLCHLFEVQWGYELRTSSVFKWSKMVLSANGLWTMACLTVCYSSHGFNNRPTGQPTRQAFHNYKVWYSNGSVKQMPGIWITTLYLWSIFTCLVLQNYNMCLHFCIFFEKLDKRGDLAIRNQTNFVPFVFFKFSNNLFLNQNYTCLHVKGCVLCQPEYHIDQRCVGLKSTYCLGVLLFRSSLNVKSSLFYLAYSIEN